MEKKFYKTITPYFDLIFPAEPRQVDFIISSITDATETKSILDVGCGTGNLSFGLLPHFQKVVGIDFDAEMIKKAKAKIINSELAVNFMTLDMLSIEKQFGHGSFDFIACFGNTLVHLINITEIENFLTQAKNVLKPGGKLFIHNINYDRVLEKKLAGLPAIENDRIKFERIYKIHPGEKLVDFETVLTVKETNIVIKNKVELYPLKESKLRGLLAEIGFINTFTYGDFKKGEVSLEKRPLILETTKKS
ncbi:class I SAM-dependent methyltransferase [Candidatus Riflebacteria bacterium]